jgi:cobalt-precorrin 5A hydrolase
MKITMVSFTRKGALLSRELADDLKEDGHCIGAYSKYGGYGLLPLEKDLKEFTKEAFAGSQALVFIGAAGIAVRAIAPYLNSKASDPAVIVIQEDGEFVIPILSGHIGGANALAERIAGFLGGRAVITTATDVNGVFAADLWAKENDLHIMNIESIKHISAALLNSQSVGFRCEYPVDGEMPGFFTKGEAVSGIYILGPENRQTEKPPFENTLFLRPKQYTVGIGCRKGIPADLLEEVFLGILNAMDISPSLVQSVATIDLKKEEEAILRLCEKFGYKLKIYSKEELMAAEGRFSSSEFVRTITGTDNVCERAALLASDQGKLALGKTAGSGVTVAIAVKTWRCGF